jgi:uncharacterized protein
MHYLIDGYNLLFRLAKGHAPFTAKRQHIIEKLNERAAQFSLHLIVVFDSSDPQARFPSRGHFDALEIIYTTKNLSADAWILEKLYSSKHPEQFSVITDDRDLKFSAKTLGAQSMSVEAFLGLLAKKKKVQKKKTAAKRVLRDTDAHMARLLRIFEERLNENLGDS